MKIKRFAAPAVSVVLATGLMITPTLNVLAASSDVASIGSAAEDITSDTPAGTDTVQNRKSEYQIVNPDGTETCDIYATVPSSFTVTIPKTIILTGTKEASGATGAYSVRVQGDISGEETVTVVPEDTVVMQQSGKDSVTADITQEKTAWAMGVDGVDESTIVAGVTTTGEIKATLSAGKWNGVFNFNINSTGPVTYMLTGANANANPNGLILNSNDLLATEDNAVYYMYDGTIYKAFNGYASYTEYATQDDATFFINRLNANAVDGHTDWKLFSITPDDYGEALAWQAETFESGFGWLNDGVVETEDFVDGSSMEYFWSEVDTGDTDNPVCYWNTGFISCEDTSDISQAYTGFIPVYPVDTTDKNIIVFDANGGRVTSSIAMLDAGAAYGELPVPTWGWAGYTFDGWYTEADGGVKVSATDIPTTSCTLYAHWVIDSATLLATADKAVTYSYNGVTYKAFNGYASYTEFATQAEAMAYIQALNDNAVDGHTDWRLFAVTPSDYAEAEAWQAEVFEDGYGWLNDGEAEIDEWIDGNSMDGFWSASDSGDEDNPVCIWNSSSVECLGYSDDSLDGVGFIPVYVVNE